MYLFLISWHFYVDIDSKIDRLDEMQCALMLYEDINRGEIQTATEWHSLQNDQVSGGMGFRCI